MSAPMAGERIFSGPLFCGVCGLPAVPFGGEDICLDHDHAERDYRDLLREEEEEARAWRRRMEDERDGD